MIGDQQRPVIEAAAEAGHIPVLEWLSSHGFAIDVQALWAACRGGKLSVLHWLRDRFGIVPGANMDNQHGTIGIAPLVGLSLVAADTGLRLSLWLPTLGSQIFLSTA